MRNLFKDYSEFYGKYHALVKEYKRSIMFVSILSGVVSLSIVYVPIIIDKIQDHKIQKEINENKDKRDQSDEES